MIKYLEYEDKLKYIEQIINWKLSAFMILSSHKKLKF